ncbi:MAG: preprotein translocase subunit YajC [Sphingomonadaceae bacterium]|nr:preprotein translocase subunit YajC [Sphingomonadaceae bacterium]
MFSSPAYAQTAAATGAGGAYAGLIQFAPLIAIFAIFYFLMIRPQQARAREHRAAIDAVKRGDEVVTAGGVIGKVTKVDDAEVEVEVAPNVRHRVVKATLAEVRTKPLPAAANDAKR